MPMSSMPEQYRTMMQAMPAECITAMQQMMQGGMHGAMNASNPAEAAAPGTNAPDFTQAYVKAMDAMHGPMMEGVMADDPDTAFVRGMIPHHQGAIDMARIVQQHGDDPQTKAWAEEIITAQEREIAEMDAWLTEKASTEAIDFGQTGGTVWSADEGGSSISAIDLGTGTVTTVPIPVAPHNVDLTPDGRFLLAVGTPATGDHGDGHDHAGGDTAGLLVMLDPQDLSKPPATVEVGAHPAHVVADRNGRAFVSLSGSDEIAVVDLAQGAVTTRIGTGAYPHGLRLSPNGAELYVANVEDGTVSVIDTASLTEAARIPVGAAPVQVGFTPDGNQVYVSLRDENRVAVIDTASREVTGRIEVGPNPIQMIATPDGRHVYVANQGTDAAPNDTVSVIDTASGEVAKTLKTGPGAHGVSASADGAFVFVTNIADDSVSVIDVERQEVIGSVPVGDKPNGIVHGLSN
ncbi:40-residue YVTN family beta-propeller repeat-containing protein [Paracoccus solventivorans]|uniref:40-residue YVTN family beta-propeller repeat-containing protein n=2 Tax=Paracoccus solventivorans TaxID=53463 RepID=A0A1M7JYS8_9RHOB|nr:40-residue YVTN family beta-propeller repeat-containing protein [Paracoccus solventivorans]